MARRVETIPSSVNMDLHVPQGGVQPSGFCARTVPMHEGGSRTALVYAVATSTSRIVWVIEL